MTARAGSGGWGAPTGDGQRSGETTSGHGEQETGQNRALPGAEVATPRLPLSGPSGSSTRLPPRLSVSSTPRDPQKERGLGCPWFLICGASQLDSN